MLFLVATPIGNLADMTFRAVSTLKECIYILAEDTRHSRILLEHYQIKTPLKSFHKFNEVGREEGVISDLQKGKTIALISDAGMPSIADPGALLVARCRSLGIEVTVLPGPSAFVTALVLSGWGEKSSQFMGFLPKKESDLKKVLSLALTYAGISIAYETAKRLVKTLSFLKESAPSRKIAVARELTKKHEEYKEGSPGELLLYYQAHAPKGEIVLLIDEAPLKIREISDEEILLRVQERQEIPLSESIRQVAKELNIPRKRVYQIAILALKGLDC